MIKTIVIAGSAGGGLNSTAAFLEEALHRHGYYCYSYKNYMSRVRGGFNYITISVSDEPLSFCESQADYLISLDTQALSMRDRLLKEDGLLLMEDAHCPEQEDCLRFRKADIDAIHRHPSAFGMVALGWLLRRFGLSQEDLATLHRPRWSDAINQANQHCARYGFERCTQSLHRALKKNTAYRLNGNQALALGAMAAGLNFYCAYPMAPSTGILNYLTAHQKEHHLFTEQAEDEIAAINSAIGAASNGARAMTGTSGGGFSLMTEAVGLSAITEVPLVVVNVQRPGPATGLPTRTEQGDFNQALGASQGEFARVILAPSDVEDCLYVSNHAMDLAHRFRVPVILLSDQYLADSTTDIHEIRWEELSDESYLAEKDGDYLHYNVNILEKSFKYPGYDASLILNDSHIHREDGFYSEDRDVTNLYKKRILDKMDLIKKEMRPPQYYGEKEPDILLLSWGSNLGILKEVLKRSPQKLGLLHFTHLYPLDPAWIDPWKDTKAIVVNIEMNALNQFGKYLRGETGFSYDYSINKYDGRPLDVDFVLEGLKGVTHESL